MRDSADEPPTVEQQHLLDTHLERVLRHLATLPDDETGVVAAAVIDGEQTTYEGSGVPGPGQTVHAERNAIRAYYEEYGEPSDDAWVVTTLSPCVYPMAGREGCSCTDLLRGDDPDLPAIPRFHTGCIDPSQVDEETYRQLGLTVSVTTDPVLQTCCRNLCEFFQTNDRTIDIPAFVDAALAPLLEQ